MGMYRTQKMLAVWPVWWSSSGLLVLLLRSHRQMWVSSEPLASREPDDEGLKEPVVGMQMVGAAAATARQLSLSLSLPNQTPGCQLKMFAVPYTHHCPHT